MAENKYVVFKLADEHYGIAIAQVERILPEQSVTKLPKTPKMLLGIFDLRGDTVAAVDLRRRLEMPDGEGQGNFVVVQTPFGRCALHVDAVDGIVDLPDADINREFNLTKGVKDEFIFGVGKAGDKLVVLLEPEYLIPDNLQKQITKVSAA
jgi:purine-binding chemotaxis protein CheW